jgi:hypothetical protein
MKNLSILFLTLLFFSCKEERVRDSALFVSGTYPVSLYIVDGDTLISPSGLNKTNFLNFRQEVSRMSENVVQVIYKYETKAGERCGSGYSDIHLVESEGKFTLRQPTNTINTYYGYATGKVFYTDAAGWDPKKDKRIRTIISGSR